MDLVSSERVKLGDAVRRRAVTIDDPDVTVRSTQLSTEGEPSTNTQCTERSRVEPLQRTPRPVNNTVLMLITMTSFQAF